MAWRAAAKDYTMRRSGWPDQSWTRNARHDRQQFDPLAVEVTVSIALLSV
jgi:hypothetical protein